MGYRVFIDSNGTEWQTWDVVPTLAERRLADRRVSESVKAELERRRIAERRVLAGTRPTLAGAMNGGWLCFDAQVEKRRLTPIPPDWMQCPEDQLEQYCARAERALRATVGRPRE